MRVNYRRQLEVQVGLDLRGSERQGSERTRKPRKQTKEDDHILRKKPNVYKGYMYPLYSKHVNIYKGKLFIKPKSPQQSTKVIVLDLDETIGSFQDLFILWQWIESVDEKNTHQILFDKLLDLYPEFLRHGILSILEYLSYKKTTGECSNIFLYTNNQCSPDSSKWIRLITQYLDRKLELKIPLFDQLICAFKIDNKRVEMRRTTHQKTYQDLIRCTLLPKSTEICFLDNSYYPKLINDRVYYIQPKSYEHSLSTEEIIERFIISPLFTTGSTLELQKWFSNYSFSRVRGNVDDFIVSQKIMYHLKEFFLLTTKKQKTRKIGIRLGRFTRKRSFTDLSSP